MPSEVWDEIIYPFPSLGGFAVEVWEWMNNFIPRCMRNFFFTCHDGIKVDPWLEIAHIYNNTSKSKPLIRLIGVMAHFKYLDVLA